MERLSMEEKTHCEIFQSCATHTTDVYSVITQIRDRFSFDLLSVRPTLLRSGRDLNLIKEHQRKKSGVTQVEALKNTLQNLIQAMELSMTS